jgi:hypothetical protein
MEAARFTPTWQQALGRGLYHGVLASVLGGTVTILAWAAAGAPPAWWWAVLIVGPPVTGGAVGVLVGNRLGTEIDARGIRTVSPFTRGEQPWSGVVDLRAERRGGRTVVSV